MTTDYIILQYIIISAYTAYKSFITAGPDGRPDWLARKSCNYMTAAVEECGNMMVGACNTEEEVVVLKDFQYQGIINQLAEHVKEWDSEKCPVTKWAQIFTWYSFILNYFSGPI